MPIWGFLFLGPTPLACFFPLRWPSSLSQCTRYARNLGRGGARPPSPPEMRCALHRPPCVAKRADRGLRRRREGGRGSWGCPQTVRSRRGRQTRNRGVANSGPCRHGRMGLTTLGCRPHLPRLPICIHGQGTDAWPRRRSVPRKEGDAVRDRPPNRVYVRPRPCRRVCARQGGVGQACGFPSSFWPRGRPADAKPVWAQHAHSELLDDVGRGNIWPKQALASGRPH